MAQQKAVEPAVDEVDDLIDELQPGAKLLKGQYTISRYINSGGFGITYLAKDSLDRDVVIKECFPSSVCRRSKVMVAARSRAHTAELRSVIQLFVREARSLAKIVHPNIVAVHNVFEDNGTAYMALDFIDGLDLQQIIDGEGKRPAPEQIVEITSKLIKAVGFIHDHDMLHRDISPDNVLIAKTGEPILIDFGAAREEASQTNRAMSALRVVKDGYSPQEFYIAGSEQGPWSDLYALGATLYHLISDEAPVNGQARLGALAEDRPDPYVPLTGRFAGYPKGFLEAIDKAMSTLPRQRLQTAKEWLAMYEGNGPADVALAGPIPGTDDAVLRVLSDFQREEAQIEATAVTGPAPVARSASRPASNATAARGKGPTQLLAGVAVALAVVAGGYMMLGTPQGTKDAVPGDSAAANAAASVPSVDTAPATTTKPEPATETASASDTTSAAAPAATEAAPVVAEPEPAAETATVEPTPAPATEPEVAADTAAPVESEPATEPVAVTAAEPAAETTAEAPVEPAAAPLVAPAGTPAANQVGFAAWDAELPFSADDRIVGGKQTAIVLRVSPDADRAEVGDWLQPGLLINSVNGTPTPTSSALTAAILNAMQVDPDGKARVVVEYVGSDLRPKTDLLTIGAVRLVSLANGVSTRTSVVDGVWTSTVTGVVKPEITTLRQGDILFRDKTTGIPLDGPDALETILRDLVAAGATQTEFSVIRDNKVSAATMQLAIDGGQ
ncbi:MAG: protein kinase domain-containing protein [Paracoccaceae bacterium]